MKTRSGTEPGLTVTADRRFRLAILATTRLALLAACFCVSGGVHATTALETWRNVVTATRTLAENDVPRAYEQAQLLQSSMPADAAPADRARLLNLLSRIEIHAALTAKAIEHAKAALKLATENNDRIGQAEAHLNLTRTSINDGDIDALVTSATQGVAVLEGVNRPDLLGEALLGMAMMYQRIGHLEDSVTMTMQDMEIAKHSRDPFAMAYAAQGLGASFSVNERPKEAYEQYVLMRDNARAAHSKILEALALNGMGVALDSLGNTQEAETYMREAVKLYRSTGAPFGTAHVTYGLADHYRRQGHYDQAIELFTDSVATWAQYDNPIGLWFALIARSQLYLKMGNHAAAFADAERSQTLAKRVNLPYYLSGSAQQLADIHAAKGEFEQAYRLSREAGTVAAEMARKKSGARMIELVKRYETESRQREIDDLTRRNQLQTAELRQRELQQRWLWTVLAASVTVLAVTAFLLMRLRRSHNVIRDLNAGLEQTIQARTAELRQQARYLRTLINTLPWRVWLKDTESRYLAANQAAADPCGLKADDLAGKTDAEVRERTEAEALVAHDREVMTSLRPITTEECNMHDGVAAWTETFKAPVLDEDGTVLGTVGLEHDISERKAVEATREAALAEAQRLARLRSEFLAQMSHELRTPLNGILGYAQILLRDRNRDPQEVARLNVIQQSGEHLLTLINDILDFAKIEAGKLELYETDIHFTRFLRVIAEMVEVRAMQKSLEFRCTFAPDLPRWVHADEKRLRQVLLNLLSNAIKFTERGMLQLDVRMSAAGRIQFEIRDTGIGIEPERIGTIFEPFEQAGDLQHRIGGTGLGLAISQQFVRMMGGEIHVESQPGKGSCFWFELALQVVDSKQEASRSPDAIGYVGPRKKALVVDDIAENRAVIVDMLGPLGFEMSEASSGEEGLDMAQAERPDLIVMDIVMPGMGGLEAIRRLRATAAFHAVPIIAVSASASGTDRESSLAAGVNAFMSKPVDFGDLLANIANLLNLDLVFAPPQETPATDAREAATITPPPAEDLNELYRLARLGNMQDVMAWAARLEARDVRYRPFASRLDNLARTYQSKALLDFVKRHLEGATLV